jgi:hypothetical protein
MVLNGWDATLKLIRQDPESKEIPSEEEATVEIILTTATKVLFSSNS